jgi:histidine triad (HIT) family protein
MEDSIFTKIIRRELPAEILYEDDTVIVILDRFPAVQGQTLVVTKKQTPYIFNLNAETYDHVMRVSKNIAKALDKAYSPLRTCVVIEGFEVPHIHVRLYPMTKAPLSLAQGTLASDEELKTEGERIRPNISI